MSKITVPLVSTTPEDSRSASFGPLVPTKLPKAKNYANWESDDGTFQNDLRNIFALTTYTRQARLNLTEDWMAIRRMDLLQHDAGQRYIGRSNVYVPAANRNLDTIVASLSRGLFPSDDYMDVISRSEDADADQKAKRIKAYIQWEFESNAHVRREMKPLLRQFASYGTTVGKHMYQRDVMTQGKLTFDGKGSYGGVFEKSCIEGLRFSTRNIFNWHVYPMTAANIDEATLVFEDVSVPVQYTKAQIKAGRWLNKESALAASVNATADLNEQELKADMHVDTMPNSSNPTNSDQSQMNTLTEVWTYLVLPPDSYAQGEDVTGPVPVKIVFTAAGVALEVVRNPFWDQKAPYEVSRLNTQPGFFYGYGYGAKMRSMQYLINDFANQTNDVGIYALNPIVKVQPGKMAGPLPPMRPGVVIPVTDKDAVTFDRPDSQQVQFGQGMLQMWLGMNSDIGGAPAIIQGTKGASTATTSQILQKQASVPLQDVVEDLEQDIIVRLMRATWMMAQQFRDAPIMLKVAGEAIKVSPEDFAIDAEFRALSSSQSINAMQRNQQATQFAQVVLSQQEALAQAGYQYDPQPLLSRIWTDGLGFRGFDQIIKKLPPTPPMPPGMPGMPGAAGAGVDPNGAPPPPGAAQAPAGDRVRSALEGITGADGAPDMAPGEGEEFMNVRSEADELAAQMGVIS